MSTPYHDSHPFSSLPCSIPYASRTAQAALTIPLIPNTLSPSEPPSELRGKIPYRYDAKSSAEQVDLQFIITGPATKVELVYVRRNPPFVFRCWLYIYLEQLGTRQAPCGERCFSISSGLLESNSDLGASGT